MMHPGADWTNDVMSLVFKCCLMVSQMDWCGFRGRSDSGSSEVCVFLRRFVEQMLLHKHWITLSLTPTENFHTHTQRREYVTVLMTTGSLLFMLCFFLSSLCYRWPSKSSAVQWWKIYFWIDKLSLVRLKCTHSLNVYICMYVHDKRTVKYKAVDFEIL